MQAAVVLVASAGVALVGLSGDSHRPGRVDRPLSTVESALREARATGAPVAVASLTTESTEYAALPSGDMRVTVSAGVVRVRRGAGWVPVDLTLVRAADGGVAPQAHPGNLVLSGPQREGTHELAAVGSGENRVAMGWAGALPAPVLSGERAVYGDALPGVDLVVAATRTGFAQSLVVRTREALDRVASVRLTLTGPGVAGFTRGGDGSLTLMGRSGGVVASVPALRMWDSQTGPGGTPLRSAPLASTVEPVGDGIALTLSPDLGWLRDPATVFPVTLDPTVNPVSTTFDTYVRQSEVNDRSTQPDLQIGLLATTPPTLTRSFLTWNVPMLAGKQITAATVSLFSFWSHTCEPRGWKIWTASAASSSGTRWDSQPGLVHEEAESTATTGGTNCADAWVTIDGTSFFQRAATAGASAAQMAIAASNEADTSGFKQFRSRDAVNTAQVPFASVTYNSFPVVGSRSTTPQTACVVGPSRPNITTFQPSLHAQVSDPEGTALAVRFEWGAVDGTGPNSTTVQGVASGGSASVTVPASWTPRAGSYRWRVVVSDGTGENTSPWCEVSVSEFAPPAEGCSGVDGDFDGDGVRDTAIADPQATVAGQPAAGVVYVASGATGTVRALHQNLAEVPDTAEVGDRFGHALAVYDANRDGCADLAVGAPLEDVDTAVNSTAVDAGGVWVLLGSPAGLAAGPAAVTLRQGADGLPDTPEAGDWFGHALAAGRTGTGQSYLVAGAPGEDVDTAVDAGMAHYIAGSVRLGLTQNSAGVTGDPETDDRFGYAVAASPQHVAVGVPGEGIGADVWAGAVDVFTHEVVGTSLRYTVQLHQGVDGVSDSTEPDDQFGKSVALAAYRPAGSTGTDSMLAVGVPGEDLTVDNVFHSDAGRVQRFHLTATGFTELGAVTYETEDGDAFGERVLLVDTDPGAQTTAQNLLLVVSTPGEDRGSVVDAGVVRVFGAVNSPLGTPASIERGTGRLPGSPVAGELLGLAVGGNQTHLLVGSPYRTGEVWAIPWSALASGSVTPDRIWQPGQNGVPAGVAAFGEVTA